MILKGSFYLFIFLAVPFYLDGQCVKQIQLEFALASGEVVSGTTCYGEPLGRPQEFLSHY